MATIDNQLSDLQLKVYDLIRLAGWDGKTCDEVEDELQLTHQSASARVNELLNWKDPQSGQPQPLIERRGARRKTRAGRQAFIYVLAGLTAADARRA